MLSYLQAIILGLIQGITEPFPISSLGHNVLVPELLGWHNIVRSEPKSESFFLAFLVALHVATALALLVFYRRQWWKLVKGFFTSIRKRRVENSHEKLVWLLIMATIPAGITGLALEHILRTQFAKPLSAAIFLTINGFILLGGDLYMKRKARQRADFEVETTVAHTAKALNAPKAGLIGLVQVGALLAGISRSGVTMVGGFFSGLDYEDAARFSFLLATPIILGAGVVKLPDLMGPLGNGVRAQVFIGAALAFIGCLLAVRYLDRYFRTKRLWPFATYCLAFGIFMIFFISLKL